MRITFMAHISIAEPIGAAVASDAATRPLVGVLGTRGFPDVQGGVERHCEELYTRLPSPESVVVFTRAPYNRNRPARSTHHGVRLQKVWSPTRTSLEAIAHSLAAVWRARTEGVRVLHVHAIGPGLVVPVARLLGLKVVFTHHGFDYTRQKWGRFARTALRLGEWCAVRFANEVLVVSREVQLSLRDRFGRESTFAPNGVEDPTPDAVDQPREEFAVMVARIVPEKGWHVLFDAVRIGTGIPHIVGIGAADHASAYSARIARESPETVEMLGALPHHEVLARLQRARVFVLPSSHEGLPIAVLEALACSTIVVASDIAPHREIITDGVNGFLFRTGDAGDLARALRQAWTLSADRRAEVAREGRATLDREYRWSRTVRAVAEAYARLLAA